MTQAATTDFRTQRLRRGWTQEELANRCAEMGASVDESHISRIERGLYSPRPRLRPVLAELLGLDVTYFDKAAS